MQSYIYNFGVFILLIILLTSVINSLFAFYFSKLSRKPWILLDCNQLYGDYITIDEALSTTCLAGTFFYIFLWVVREDMRGSTTKNNTLVNFSISDQILHSLIFLSMFSGISSASVFLYIQNKWGSLYGAEIYGTTDSFALHGPVANVLKATTLASGGLSLISLLWVFSSSVGNSSVQFVSDKKEKSQKK
jgi:hypothetical protein